MTTIDPRVDIGHVHLKVADLDRALAFYCGVLGFELHQRLRRPGGVPLRGRLPPPHRPQHLGEPRRPPPPRGTTGLYHVAIRYPGPRARSPTRCGALVDAGIPLDGASDHGVSEALYLRDPDGNGIELYRDRPREEWPRDAGRQCRDVHASARPRSAAARRGRIAVESGSAAKVSALTRASPVRARAPSYPFESFGKEVFFYGNWRTVKWFDDSKGYGLITPDEGTRTCSCITATSPAMAARASLRVRASSSSPARARRAPRRRTSSQPASRRSQAVAALAATAPHLDKGSRMKERKRRSRSRARLSRPCAAGCSGFASTTGMRPWATWAAG